MVAAINMAAADQENGVLENQRKHSRSQNWLPREEDILLEVMGSYIDVVHSKQTNNGVVRCQKQTAWIKLTEEFNLKTTEKVRSMHEIQKKWKNLKSRSRQEVTAVKNKVIRAKKPEVAFRAAGYKVRQLLLRSEQSVDNAPDSDSCLTQHEDQEENDTNEPHQLLPTFTDIAGVCVTKDNSEETEHYELDLAVELQDNDLLQETPNSVAESIDISTSIPASTHESATQQPTSGAPVGKRLKANRTYKEELCDSKVKVNDIIAKIEMDRFKASEARLRELHQFDVEQRKKQLRQMDLQIEKAELEVQLMRAKVRELKNTCY